jgi:hypothetical protein
VRFDAYLTDLERTAERLPSLLARWGSLSEHLRDAYTDDLWVLLASKDEALGVAEGNPEMSQRVIEAVTNITGVVMSHPQLGVDLSCLYPSTAIEARADARGVRPRRLALETAVALAS